MGQTASDRGRPSHQRVAAPSEWVVDRDEAGLRLEAFLALPARLGSRGRVRRAVEHGKVMRNGREVLPEQLIQATVLGDRLRFWDDRPGSARTRRRPAQAQDRPLPVIYEDQSLLVVNKPPGLLAVPLGRRAGAPSAEGLLAGYLRSKGKRRAWVVHRIDRDTSGLIVFATSPHARDALKAQFARKEPERVYLALVHGTPDPLRGVWHDYVRWDAARLATVPIDQRDPRARECVSEYHVVESFPIGASLLRVRLRTGRRNQIRVQATQHGHPLLGERMYAPSGGRGAHLPVASRQALHAWRLGFQHPDTGRPMRLEAPIPDDFEQWLRQLRARGGVGTGRAMSFSETMG